MVAKPGSVHLDRFDPKNAALPRYEGLDPATYHDGLSEPLHEHVSRHMARRDYVWQDDLVELSTEEMGEKQMAAMAQALAAKAQALLAEA